MTKEQLAEMLNGREYLREITPDEDILAKESGLVVIFGCSDDLMELRGAIDGEFGCFDGGAACISKRGLLPEPECEECEDCPLRKREVENYAIITANWDKDGYSWTYSTEIPHATFIIYEDGEPYCKGIVISINDLPDVMA